MSSYKLSNQALGHVNQDLSYCIYGSTIDFNSVLELGCMFGDKVFNTACLRKVGIDIFRPYIEQAVANYSGTCTFLNHSAPYFVGKLVENAFDVILIVDMLEHLGKVEAEELIRDCKRVAKRIVLFIPLGVDIQETDVTGYSNPYQRHLSTWYAEDLVRLDFDVATWVDWHKKEDGRIINAAFCIYDRPT